MKELIIVCGVSGSGKTTFANMMAKQTNGAVFSADDYFTTYTAEGVEVYEWNEDELGKAHYQCICNTRDALKNEVPFVYVANTFTKERDMRPYRNLGKKYGYKITIIAVGNYHGNTNIHNVPDETIENMRNKIRNSFKF